MSDNTAVKFEYDQKELHKDSSDPEALNALIKKDLQALAQNPRCSDELRAAIWSEVGELRKA